VGAETVKSVAKVLDILEHLGHARRASSVSEIARSTGLNASTAHRLLQTLARRGYVEQNPATRDYALGPRLFELGSAYIGGQDLAQVVRPFVERLRDQVGETIHFGILSQGHVVEICNASSHHPVGVTLRTGRRDPAHCTAMGKVLLAALPEAELSAYLGHGELARPTRRTMVDPRRLRRELQQVRRQGYATDEEELADNLCCVGVPVAEPDGAVVAAMSLAMPKMRFRPERLPEWVALLNDAARQISGRLRFAAG
jgi:DNA-binding IclR family transcriptional regulator